MTYCNIEIAGTSAIKSYRWHRTRWQGQCVRPRLLRVAQSYGTSFTGYQFGNG